MLAMIESISHMQKSVNNSLKKVGEAEFCLSSNELDLLAALTSVLKEFEKFTELVSCSSVPVLSMVPLMKLRIKRVCQPSSNDEDAIQLLKHHILHNVDRRLPENDFMKISQELDTMTKDIFTPDEAIMLVQKAFQLATQKGILDERPTTASAANSTSVVNCQPSTSFAESDGQSQAQNDKPADQPQVNHAHYFLNCFSVYLNHFFTTCQLNMAGPQVPVCQNRQ